MPQFYEPDRDPKLPKLEKFRRARSTAKHSRTQSKAAAKQYIGKRDHNG